MLISSIKIEEDSKEVKIIMFAVCAWSHLRPIISIAEELSQYPNVKVTVVVSSRCEEMLMAKHYKFDIEAIKSSVDLWKHEDVNLWNAGKYISEYENDVLNNYIPKWKDSKNLPDIIVNEFFAFAGRDLSEIYNIHNVIVLTNLLDLSVVIGEDFYPEYYPMYTPTMIFKPTDNIILRALRYLPKHIVKHIIHYNLIYNSNSIRSTFGLSWNSSNNLNSFYIIESFFGFEHPLLLPQNIELASFLDTNSLNNPLDPELKAWINNSKGFIYISTGSIYKLTNSQQQTLTDIFSSMSYDFLVSSKVLKSDLINVKIVDWVNQVEVLQSNHILAFITHGGHASIMESIQSKVPIICVPLEADQFFNCDAAENKGIGKTIRQEEFDIETVSKALNELIENTNFKKNIKNLNSIMKSYKGKIKAAEIILEISQIGCNHLIPRWKYLPWYQRNELDIFVVYLILMIIFSFCIKKLWKRNYRKKQD